MSARFMSTLSRSLSGSRLAVVAPLSGRVELVEELGAAGLFVDLADGFGAGPEAVQRPGETPVRLGRPSHVAAAPPSGLAQLVETPVVADPEVRVRGDGIVR